MSNVYVCPDTGLPAIDAGGMKRLLAHIPDSGKLKALPRFADHFEKVPRGEWKPVKRRSLFQWILDQGQHGSCTDHAGCYVHRKTRVLKGMKDVELSATFGYAMVNGGQDNGAMVSDILGVMQKYGRCLMSEFPEGRIYQQQIPQSAFATAKRFVITEAYTLADFDDIVSAIQLDFIPAFALQVGNNFDHFDGDGAVGFSRGPGNHAVSADGFDFTPKGRPLLDMPNSWGTSWGDGGRGMVGEEHCNNVQQDAYCVRVALDDPQDPNVPPAVA